MPGTLFVVSTPIGNLEDITFRAVRVLGEVDVIACEDTRHSRKLLNHYGIKTRTVSYHEHNEHERAVELVAALQSGTNVAIVSDAGTPGISDPGFRLVHLASASGLRVVPVPGPTALIAALVASGLPADEFFFAGFLPSKSSARRTRLNHLSNIRATLVFYEAPHRIARALKDMREVLGEREAVVARELTKVYEEIVRGRLSELETHFGSEKEVRGELVIIVDQKVIDEPASGEDELASLDSVVAALEAQGLDSRAALKQAAKKLGISRAEAYRQLVVLRNRK
ncbi:MAG TPA: 16S rRNA (cytidine(1402)-2'-O)-methyltransferase [Pyrinomonadaceae bacterium]|nr:16S rRNA (cytidine(1402)-2'-O)-methyltransferase [Pyrinomonadaceae bacterium]